MFARWGGEEFMILSPYADVEHSARVAEKLRSVVEAHQFGGPASVTCSFDVTQFDVQDTAHCTLVIADHGKFNLLSDCLAQEKRMPALCTPLIKRSVEQLSCSFYTGVTPALLVTIARV